MTTFLTPRIHWWLKDDPIQNFGDFLGAFVADRLALTTTITADSYRLIGSVIDDGLINSDILDPSVKPEARIVFWGAGKRDESPLTADNLARSIFACVRGPLTRDSLDLPETTPIGDTALLVPLVYQPKTSRRTTGKTLCVPHIHDKSDDSLLLETTGADLIIKPTIDNNFAALTEMIDDIASASFILAGSLHAAIIACAYDTPFCYFDAGHVDLPFKWRDFSASIGIGVYFAPTVADGQAIYAAAIESRMQKPQLVPILASAPFQVRPEALQAAVINDAPPAPNPDAAITAENIALKNKVADLGAKADFLFTKVQRYEANPLSDPRHLPRAAGRLLRRAARPLAFHSNGKPRGWVRKILFRSSGAPRKWNRFISHKKNGAPRAAFRAYLAASGAASGNHDFFPRLANIGHASSILVCADLPPLFDQHSGGLRLQTIIELLSRQKPDRPIIFCSMARETELPGTAATPEGRGRYESALRAAGVVEVIYGIANLERRLQDPSLHISDAFLSFPNVANNCIPLIRDLKPDATIIYDMVDFHGLRMQREAELKNDPALAAEAAKMRELEISLANVADITITVSDAEKGLILDLAPLTDVEVIPNIFVLPKGAPPSVKNRKNILFVGGFWHTPNNDAVKWFVNSVFPIVRAAIPGVRFTIAGSNPGAEVVALGQHGGVDVLGYVEDLTPLYDNARVAVAPLRYGAGVKGKVGQAMALGLPSVVTSIGAEGMISAGADHFLIADDEEAFASHVIKLLTDDIAWTSIQAAARRFIEDNYSSGVVATKINQIFQ